MPLSCDKGSVRYRWKGKVRLAFCGNKVIETKKKGGNPKNLREKASKSVIGGRGSLSDYNKIAAGLRGSTEKANRISKGR